MNTREIHPSLLKRKIIHIDMDAFFAAIEIRENPELKGKAIAIGGSPKSRGVVATASYEARKFGVRSAMSCAYAAKICPHLIFLPSRFPVYKQVSQQIRKIMLSYTSFVEPLSLDEAYLDVSESTMGENPPQFATHIANEIRERIFNETGLTASAGIAPNKMIAKIASDVHKPNGFMVVKPAQAFDFMQALPVRKVPFVGPKTESRLAELGIYHCRDFLKYAPDELTQYLGNMGIYLWERAQGIDESPIETTWERKSLGAENTFPKDLELFEDLERELRSLAQEVADGLKSENKRGKTITLKVKYFNFRQVTRSSSLKHFTDSALDIFSLAHSMLKERFNTEQVPIRLLGIQVSRFDPQVLQSDSDDTVQPSDELFESDLPPTLIS